MSCTNHPAVIENIQTCARCTLPFCSNCLVIFQGKHLCGPCKNERIRALQSGRPEGELVLATVGRRLGALWIDGMIVGVPLYALMFAWMGSRAFGPNPSFGLINVLFYVAPIVYEAMFLSAGGQTPGKKSLKIKVVNPDGSDISNGQAWGRAVSKHLINICVGIGYLPAFFTKQKTCVHDALAKTRVIRL